MSSTTFVSYVGAIAQPGLRGSEGLMLRPADLFGCSTNSTAKREKRSVAGPAQARARRTGRGPVGLYSMPEALSWALYARLPAW